METIDLKKQYKHLYQPSAKAPTLVEVPEFQFLTFEGQIEPGHEPGTSPSFAEAVETLYAAAYTIKFAYKKRAENPIDYPVMALEGLWWVEGGEFDFNRKDKWRWKLMIMTPDIVTPDAFQAALQQLRKKRPELNLEGLCLERFAEGLCVQMLHVGPYAEEPRTLEKMQAFAAEQGYEYHGRHHEIYLGDPRRAQPEKLKTILRHPVRLKIEN